MTRELHPSGLTWDRWEWPFKTPAERKIVAAYFQRMQRQAQADVEPALL